MEKRCAITFSVRWGIGVQGTIEGTTCLVWSMWYYSRSFHCLQNQVVGYCLGVLDSGSSSSLSSIIGRKSSLLSFLHNLCCDFFVFSACLVSLLSYCNHHESHLIFSWGWNLLGICHSLSYWSWSCHCFTLHSLFGSFLYFELGSHTDNLMANHSITFDRVSMTLGWQQTSCKWPILPNMKYFILSWH